MSNNNEPVAWEVSLPREELLAVLMSDDDARSEVFIAAASDPVTKTVSLLRGDRGSVVVPFSHFKPSGDGLYPDFTQIAVTDFGRTVSFGRYEAASDAILYEVDPEYRKNLLLRITDAEREAIERNLKHANGRWLMHVSEQDQATIVGLLERLG